LSRLSLVVPALLAFATTTARAQEPDPITDSGPRLIEGRVAKPVGDSLRGVPGVWVVLHRVGSDTAGPVDSVRSGAAGAYRIPYRQLGDERTIYFVSAQYADIAYFSPPLPAGGATEDEAEIIVYDTASTGIPVRVQGRHVVVSAAGVDGIRDVVEVYELANESDLTLVSPDDSLPTWSGSLPPGVTDVRIGEGDVAADAMRITGQRLDVVAPIAPGLKSFSLAYRLPPSAFPLRLPIDAPVVSLEVLLEDPGVRIEGAGLAPVASVNIEGRVFRRFTADSVPAGAVVRAAVPALGQSRTTLYVAIVLIAVMAAMLVALARSFRGRGAVGVPASAAPAPRSADALAREIAALDEEFERSPPTDREMREAVASRRAGLKDALNRALAAEQRRG
jgi:hypothetical protein